MGWSLALALITATLLIRGFDLDRLTSGFFYVEGEGWPLRANRLVQCMDRFGNALPIALALISLVILVAGMLANRPRRHRRLAGFMVLTFVLGPGMITNTLLKQNWHRARPRALVEFGGSEEYRPVLSAPDDSGNMSFPSGHVACASFLAVPGLLMVRRRRRWGHAWFAAGIGYGSLMAFARIAAGAHFLSDAVWAIAIVLGTALVVEHWIPLPLRDTSPVPTWGDDHHPARQGASSEPLGSGAIPGLPLFCERFRSLDS